MITATLNSHDHKKKTFFSCNYGIIVRSVCVFSLHFRAQSWNFVKSFIRMQKVKFGSDTKVLLPDVHFTDQTTGIIGQKKIFFRFHFPIAHWIDHVLQTKVYKNIIPLFFVSQKLLKFINYWNQGFHNENTNIKCIYYINNMFSKIFINQAFKSYTSFDFIYTYSRYRFNIIKLWW